MVDYRIHCPKRVRYRQAFQSKWQHLQELSKHPSSLLDSLSIQVQKLPMPWQPFEKSNVLLAFSPEKLSRKIVFISVELFSKSYSLRQKDQLAPGWLLIEADSFCVGEKEWPLEVSAGLAFEVVLRLDIGFFERG